MTTSRGTPRCDDSRRSAWPRVRWFAVSRTPVTWWCEEGVDVIQPDVVLAGGIGGGRCVAATADLLGRMYSPHTWSNGMGLAANLHLALAVSTCPFVEVPYDPPAWSPERRDALMPEPIQVAADGTIAAPDGPGLGVTPDLDALEAYRTA